MLQFLCIEIHSPPRLDTQIVPALPVTTQQLVEPRSNILSKVNVLRVWFEHELIKCTEQAARVYFSVGAELFEAKKWLVEYGGVLCGIPEDVTQFPLFLRVGKSCKSFGCFFVCALLVSPELVNSISGVTSNLILEHEERNEGVLHTQTTKLLGQEEKRSRNVLCAKACLNLFAEVLSNATTMGIEESTISQRTGSVGISYATCTQTLTFAAFLRASRE
jgi:hypothetical protein